MTEEQMYLDSTDTVEIAFASEALFEQYDDDAQYAYTTEDSYDNLYPCI